MPEILPPDAVNAERAAALLRLPVTGELHLVGERLVYRAFAGATPLPITADTQAKAVHLGRGWLRSFLER